MGDQSTDAAFWRKTLEKINPEESARSKRRICLYDLVMGIVQDSPNPIQENEILEDEDLQRMLTVVKLYNGDVFYSKKQIEILKKLDDQGLEEVRQFSKRARKWHDVKQSQLPISTLAPLLYFK
jgi:hypothetical protein